MQNNKALGKQVKRYENKLLNLHFQDIKEKRNFME